MLNSTKNRPGLNGLKKLKINSYTKSEINYSKSPIRSTQDAELIYKRSYQHKRTNSKRSVKKLKLVDIYNYDKNKWKELLPKKEITLENILRKDNTYSYLDKMLGDWGSKIKNKNK
jgi:hypothetical protein